MLPAPSLVLWVEEPEVVEVDQVAVVSAVGLAAVLEVVQLLEDDVARLGSNTRTEAARRPPHPEVLAAVDLE